MNRKFFLKSSLFYLLNLSCSTNLNKLAKNNYNKKVIIIGAGMSGCSAAYHLKNEGYIHSIYLNFIESSFDDI